MADGTGKVLCFLRVLSIIAAPASLFWLVAGGIMS
jgi:hypothetical protein